MRSNDKPSMCLARHGIARVLVGKPNNSHLTKITINIYLKFDKYHLHFHPCKANNIQVKYCSLCKGGAMKSRNRACKTPGTRGATPSSLVVLQLHIPCSLTWPWRLQGVPVALICFGNEIPSYIQNNNNNNK